jgi:thiamine pyrophosphate-dependent acetolactate synthase large subunit-like protein
MQNSELRTGAQVLVEALAIQGVDLVFCVPGESYLAVLDVLYDRQKSIRLVVCRHEAAAANMAEAHGKLTGRPGICFVTRGPGAAHASVGLHTAFQDSTPMILFVGQVTRTHQHREGFQELDYPQTFGLGLSKWTAQIDNPRRIPEFVSRAFHVALSGRAGPVVLALPERCTGRDVHGGRRWAARIDSSSSGTGENNGARQTTRQGPAPVAVARRKWLDSGCTARYPRIRRRFSAAHGGKFSPPGSVR